MTDTTRFPGDPLSAAARQILRIGENDAYADLLPAQATGPTEVFDLLDALAPAALFDAKITDPHAAACVHAGLWLWHDWLAEAHRIVQVIETPDGAFWHASQHRREGDFSNAKYWYAQCRNHPVLATIQATANELLRDVPADKALLKLTLGTWSGPAFVDLVEAVSARPDDPRRDIAVMLQRMEWRLLFDHCVRAAVR